MRSMALLLAVVCGAGMGLAQVVSRDMVNPEGSPWRQGDWVSAGGRMSLLDERAPGAPEESKSLRIEVTFPARTFAFWDGLPLDGTIPGDPQRVSGWVRSSGTLNALMIRFADSTGNVEPEINGRKQKLELGVGGQMLGEWIRFEAVVPAHWPRPLRFSGVVMQNWGNRNEPEARTSVVDLCDLRVFTEVGNVPREERPVLASVQFPAHGNIFYADEDKPTANLVVGSWLGEELTLQGTASVASADGSVQTVVLPAFTGTDFAKHTIALPFAQPGAYTVTIDLQGLPEPKTFSHRYVVVLRPPELTEEQKQGSPYALNIHSGSPVDYERVARLGFVWVRDYAFTFSWMKRARGDGAYGGWPWYPKILEGISSAGLKLLPCLVGALKEDPDSEEPSPEWRRDIANIIAAFPQITCWELDNEFHLGGKDYDAVLAGYRYGRFHQVFGEISKAIAPDNWVVEQGAASIPIEAARTHIAAGRYDNIDVLNGHRYAGTSAPEISRRNANTGQADSVTSLFRDDLLEWSAVANMDGRDRQVWITEWGWDTKAGQPVTEWEQAAYLQRGYLLGFACGIDKLFWYWYDDSSTANAFFDGCGIFDHKPKLEPKPVAAAFAALRSLLPEGMKYVGYARLSPNAMVQIFESDGKLVAAAFLIDPEKPEQGLTIDPPKHAAAFDMFGAAIPGGPRKLDLAPTWYLDIDRECEWVRQAPLEVTSRHYIRSVSGEPIPVTVADVGDYSITVPEGWTSERTETGFSVVIPEGTPRGAGVIYVAGEIHGATKMMPIDVDIIPEAFLKSEAVGFDGSFKVTVHNQASDRKRHVVRPALPAGWKVEPAEAVTELDAGQSQVLDFALVQTAALRAGDAEGATPRLVVYNEKGMVLDAVPVVPREWRLAPVEGLKLDGDLGDWPEQTLLPGWMLGPRGELETAEVRFGYAPEGLYIGVEMRDSKGFVADPRAFWRAADCLELMFGPVANFREGAAWAKSDRQFWMCPLVDEGRVYLGNWSRHPDVAAVNDAPIQSYVKRIEGGYVMELLIPAEQLGEWAPKPGDEMAMSFTIAVQGLRNEREVFWPASKLDNVVSRPWMWGRVTLD